MSIYWSSLAAFARVLADEATHHLTQGARVNCAIGTNAHPAEQGYLCGGHLERLSATLRDIEDQASVLSAVPSFAAKTGRSGSLASHRSPAVLDAIVATDPRSATPGTNDPLAYDDTASVLNTLHTWAHHIRAERGFNRPTAITITGERDTLTRSLDWIAGQHYARDFYAEMRALLNQLKRTNGTEDDRPQGRCYLPVDGLICGGPIWIDDAHGHATCARCHQTWDGAQLALLHHALEQAKLEAARPHTHDGRPMLTAQELVNQGYSSSIANVRTTAHRRRHTAVQGHYDPHVFEKVQA